MSVHLENGAVPLYRYMNAKQHKFCKRRRKFEKISEISDSESEARDMGWGGVNNGVM